MDSQLIHQTQLAFSLRILNLTRQRRGRPGHGLRHAQFVLRSLVPSYPSDVRVVHVFLTPLLPVCRKSVGQECWGILWLLIKSQYFRGRKQQLPLEYLISSGQRKMMIFSREKRLVPKCYMFENNSRFRQDLFCLMYLLYRRETFPSSGPRKPSLRLWPQFIW